MSKITVNCETCKSKLERLPYQIKASKTGFFFCDRDCKSKWHSKEFKEQMITKKCDICEKEITKSKYKASLAKYCSRECLAESKARKARITVKCNYCKKEFIKKKCMVNNKNFCTKLCSTKFISEFSTNKVTLKCIICDSKFERVNSQKDIAKTCSIKCASELKSYMAIHDSKTRQHLINNGLKSVRSSKKYNTIPELMIKDILEELNIEYIQQKKFFNRFSVDFYLPKHNTIIEVNGDFWHGNPEIYGEGKKPLSKFQIEKIKKDAIRESIFIKEGYNFLVLWEYDIHNRKELILNKITNLYP